jgi:undecaprenyl-diphosphatase
MIEQWPAWDTELFLTLNGWGVSWLDQVMLLFSTIWLWIPLYALIAFVRFKQFPLTQAVIFMAACVVGVVLTDQGSYWMFKETFQRLRPCQEEELLAQMRFLAPYCGLYGFVSSHAANTFGFAVIAGGIFNHVFPKLRTGLLVWALVVSYSRIYIGVHYPLDIFGGALFGVIVGRLVLAMIKRQLAAVATLNAQP